MRGLAAPLRLTSHVHSIDTLDDRAQRGLIIGLQVLLAICGLAGGYFHAFPVTVHDDKANLPVVDMVTIAWLGLLVVAAVFPNVSMVAFGDVTVKLTDATDSPASYQEASTDLAQVQVRTGVFEPVHLGIIQSIGGMSGSPTFIVSSAEIRNDSRPTQAMGLSPRCERRPLYRFSRWYR